MGLIIDKFKGVLMHSHKAIALTKAAIEAALTGQITSHTHTLPDNSVSYIKIAAEFKDDILITENNIDWSTGFYKAITLTTNTTYTFANIQKGKVIHLKITGAFVPSFPAECTVINGGNYIGSKQNDIYIECVNSALPEFKVSILTEP